jgi:hypothetical protein
MRPKITVTADGAGVVSRAWSPVLADLADVTTPMAELAEALDRPRDPQPRRDPGRVLVDLAVAVANGAEAVGDITVLVNQPPLFVPVASDSTCCRLLDALDERRLAAVAGARARAGKWHSLIRPGKAEGDHLVEQRRQPQVWIVREPLPAVTEEVLHRLCASGLALTGRRSPFRYARTVLRS